MRQRPIRLGRGLGAVALLLTLAGAGCSSGRFRLPTIPIASVAPEASSPGGALRLLEWCWNRLDLPRCRQLFTDDYRFLFSLLDPFGNAYRDNPWTREDELISATHLFQGGHATEPPASSITLTLDRNFRISNDPRPGKAGKWHKSIRTSVALQIVDPDKETVVTGFANFFLVRGDSAAIPRELLDKGFGPDSTRWYIERWEDDTATNAPGGTSPARADGAPSPASQAPPSFSERLQVSWGGLKAIYR